ncbi:7151_t:CDS:1, partial [Scutellospora calospora]
IFTETYPELITLNTNILELQSIYQSTYNEKKIFDELLEENNDNDNILISELFYNIDNNIFSKIQINYFYKIFNQKFEFFVKNFDKKQKELTE